MVKIVIIGAGGFGREVLMLINQINNIKRTYMVLGFYDDNIVKGDFVNGYLVLGKIKEINAIDEKIGVIFAIGNPEVKEKLYNCISNKNIFYPTLIHPSIQILPEQKIKMGYGNIFTSGVVMTTNIIIGNFVILNLSCTVGHDVVIKDFSSFMPSVNISGEVMINSKVYVGTGATIINKIKIGKWATIGAGAVIIRDVPDYATVVGNPGKVIKIKKLN